MSNKKCFTGFFTGFLCAYLNRPKKNLAKYFLFSGLMHILAALKIILKQVHLIK
jgi:hypothetical protein